MGSVKSCGSASDHISIAYHRPIPPQRCQPRCTRATPVVEMVKALKLGLDEIVAGMEGWGMVAAAKLICDLELHVVAKAIDLAACMHLREALDD